MRQTFGEMFHFEYDGSLPDNSVETITEVFDNDYFKEHQIAEKWTSIIRKYYGRHNISTGCHVHFNREAFADDDNILSYLVLMNRSDIWKILTVGSGRNPQHEDYHERYYNAIRLDVTSNFTTHAYCFTIHDETIECRAFEAFTSAIMLKRIVAVVHGLVNLANDITPEKAQVISLGEVCTNLRKFDKFSETAFRHMADKAFITIK